MSPDFLIFNLIKENGFSTSVIYGGEFRDSCDAHALVGQIRLEF